MQFFRQRSYFSLLGLAVMASALVANGADEDLTEFSKLLTRHKEAVDELASWPELKVSSGHAFRAGDAVYFKLDKWPADVAEARLVNCASQTDRQA